ncbi:hypothetical protein EBI01_14230 [Marinomonas rhizomae]|uniref:Uncharacterized protein n=1 Tax=Marinomonas rhizomae TaxID=491948 RepID=A0A366IZP1_9GAMM|nr:hypothetical protein [Marinomonas rhizomae]RBP80077.1 hypothetical protein DFP80_112133 [Marinomonas rhizomae]RNF72000.1 hypothetical protein EBI01_14230 [Marinomonas rhizomae]
MKVKIFKAAAVVVCLSSVAAFGFNLDVFGWFKKNNSIDSMIEYVPADTALFLGGVSNKKLVTSSDEMMAQFKGNGDADAFMKLLESLPPSKGLDFVNWLVKDYYDVASNGGMEIYQHYGLDVEGARVIYLDGVFPVTRIALENEAAFLALIKQAAQETDVTLGAETIGGQTLTTVELVNKDDVVLKLGFIIKDKVLTAAVISQKEDKTAQEQRFALAKPTQSIMADSWKKDGEAYNFLAASHGYINLQNIANAILDKDSRAHQQVKALVGDDLPELSNAQMQCKDDIVNIVSGVPRVVFGINSYDIQGDDMAMGFSYALEIKNANILGELNKLRGFIPSYLNTDNDLTLGLGIGVASDAVSPVLTSLWRQFTTADFSCKSMLRAQEKLREQNPAALSVFTSMAQGFSGVSVGIFDIEKDENSQIGLKYDAIATLTSEKPEVLAALAGQYLPMLRGIQIPTDGRAVNLADSGLPIDAFVAIKGKHLVAYSGEKSQKIAEQLTTEEVVQNGMVAVAMDSTKLSDLVMNFGQYSANMGNDCTDLYTVSAALRGVPFTLNVQEGFNGKGYESNWSMYFQDLAKIKNIKRKDLLNSFNVEYLDEQCNWIDTGIENFNEDGTGTFVDTDESNRCNVFESSFKWSHFMGFITETSSDNRFRSSCDSEWEKQESIDFSCQILGAKNTDFYCLQDDSDYKTLYRYTQK